MRIISHRSYLEGPDDSIENKPEHIHHVINNHGFDVEIDLWKLGNKFFLGHDCPRHEITNNFLEFYKKKLWIHCKNEEALIFCSSQAHPDFIDDLNYFWHEQEKFALTSKKYIWNHYQTNPQLECNISVLLKFTLEETESLKDKELILGQLVCTDYPKKLLEIVDYKNEKRGYK